uniref:MARVEL domain-containing protein n=1 Tax=Panagrellus redivivus TaxID=6233 RepID=A0A7E4ZVM2_PANRE
MDSISLKPAQPASIGYSRPAIQLQRQLDSDVAATRVHRPDPEKPYTASQKALESNVYYYDNAEVKRYERIVWVPHMCAHPYALLRWFELFLLIVLHWLVEINCVGISCTMIMHEFNYKAHGQAFVLFADALLAVCCMLILTAYATNMHKAQPLLILGFERLYCMGGIFLMVICGIVGTFHAIETTDPDINKMGRGSAGIRPQWIAAAILEFLMAILFGGDYFGQTKKGFPFVFNLRHTSSNEADNEAQSRPEK